jgi:TrmH family RNA methyltransferase
MDSERVDCVLVRPSRPANVAAACRALKNMGFRRLRLVEPPPGLDDPAARALAYGAWDVLDGALACGSLAEAIGGATLVAGTSARWAEGAWTPRELAARAEERTRGGRLAVVFGPEATGLANAELALCHARVHVPTDAAQPSLNLAQAVLLVAYELRLARPAGAAAAAAEAPVPVAAQEEALADLARGLAAIGYLNPQNPEAILSELRALLARAAPTPREVALLRGIARQMRWAGSVARGGDGGA